MSDLRVRVWQNYGRMRLYVSADGAELGWYDPRSGKYELAAAEMAAEFWAAAMAECQRQRAAGQLGEPVLPPAATRPANVPRPAPAPPPVHAPPRADAPPGAGGARREPGNGHWVVRDPEWDDLTVSAPGSAARAHAVELRREHPVLTPLARVVGIRTRASRFAMGAKGERRVGRKLNRWAESSGWHVMHAVPVGSRGTDIDHVIVGPFGIVTVNTKTTASTVWVGEHGMKVGRVTVDYLRKSRAEARRAARLMSRATGWQVPVQPVIVFVGARKFTVRRGGPPDVAVLATPRALRRWLRKQRRVLGPGEVAELYAAARRPATWQAPAPRSR